MRASVIRQSLVDDPCGGQLVLVEWGRRIILVGATLHLKEAIATENYDLCSIRAVRPGICGVA